MPLQTDLSVSPYFDDYSANKDYYKVLFRPGVAVQTRELNQLQTMLQAQIERFGDNVFKRGTIIDGCDITFHNVFPFAKIKDNEADGAPVNVLSYIGYNVKNQANITPLVATITTVVSGFETRNPDLNTLYLRYINSGYSNVAGVSTEESAFAANQQLTVYDPDYIIEKVTSYNDSSGFSNTDSVVIVSALAVQNSTGGTTFANNFYVGDHINDSVANAQIVAVDTTSNATAVILRIKPRAIDLKAANSTLWTFTVNTNVVSTNAAPSSLASIVGIVGEGAVGTLKTGALGEIDLITITGKGSGYYVLPTVSIASTGATTGQIAAANVIAQNYLTNITVANSSVSPIGTGYAMTVGQGVIYQKGYFSRVNEHLVVVDKYANTPDLMAVGFDTTEEVINSNQDPTLLDNATGAPNYAAPGGNRLKLTPTLVALTKAQADANAEFFSVAEFSMGNPYKQNRQTVYNVIGNELARRTYEESGNYVIDQFVTGIKSSANIAAEATSFKIQIDPGVAYINGKRIETVTNYETTVRKGTDTIVANNVTVSLNYGNYIRIKQVGGSFIFKTGDTVDLYPTAGLYISNTSLVGTTPSAGALGTTLGTARIRSMTHESGTPGTAEAVYRLYLFDIRLATARNFKLIKSVFYNGTNKGIADTVLENGDAVLMDNNLSSLLYSAGVQAVNHANNLSYVYRTVSNTASIAANGVLTISVSGGETFPYTGTSTLSTAQEKDIIIVPLANAQLAANIAGTLSCNTTSTQVNGSSTAFLSALVPGDFLKINGSFIAQVNNIVNNTVLFTRSTPSSGAAANNAVVYFPQNVPLSLERSTRAANVNAGANTLIVNFGAAINVATTATVAYNVRSSNTQPVTKTVQRDRYIRLRLANNAASNSGPWALGISDVFRMKSVHKGPNATFTTSDVTDVSDISQYFYIDHNQTEDYYGISYLYKKPNVDPAITTGDYLLVKLDHFTDSGEGLKAPGASGTYNLNDAITLASSTSSINTIEIPELYGNKGNYYDLRDQFDFRPQSANTVAANSVAGNAPINPTEPSNATRFSAVDKKFPAPDSTLTGVLDYYVGRVDRVVIDDNNQFHIMEGTPGVYEAPQAPENGLSINVLNIPPYPSMPSYLSTDTIQFIDTRIASEKYTNKRMSDFRVNTPVDSAARAILQPRGYTMKDIGSLERRITDLEYYTSFTLMEALAQKKVIPSSANSAMDRFKFGYFVDSFDSYAYSDITNPGYAASVIDGFLSPLADQINIEAAAGSEDVTLPFIEYKFIGQNKATDGPVYSEQTNSSTSGANSFNGTITVVPPGAQTAPTSNTTTQITAVITQKQRSTSNRDNAPYVYEEFFYTMSATTGPVEFYINSRDNYIAAEIFQSGTQDGPWTSIKTSATASGITAADKVTKKLSLNGPTDIEGLGSLDRKSSGPVGHWIEDQFKLLWTHVPASGLYYKIRIYKGGSHGGMFGSGQKGTFEFKLFYPADSLVNGAAAVTANAPTSNYALNWFGNVFTPTLIPALFSLNYGYGITVPSLATVSNITPAPATFTSAESVIDLTISGLKPNTIHTITLDGINIATSTKQDNKLLGQAIVSDANGLVDLLIYYGPNIVAATDVEKAAAAVLQTAGTKTVTLTSSDATSRASGTIQVPGFVKAAINTPAPVVTPSFTSTATPAVYGRSALIANQFISKLF